MSTTTPAIAITGIAFTAYPVTDVKRARKFYEGILGLKSTMAYENEGKAWIEYDIGPGTLAIGNVGSDKWNPSPNGGCATLEVAAFAEAVIALRQAGVRFVVEPMDSGVCQMAGIADPDGNSIMIHQRRAAQS